MKTEYILKADLLDIIFENRNKNYGAYPLRKHYNERLYKALGITFLFFSILSVYVLLHKPNVVLVTPFTIDGPTKTKIPVPVKKDPIPAKPNQPAQRPSPAQIFSRIQIVDSTDQTVKPIKNIDSSTDISNIDRDGPKDAKPIVHVPVVNQPIPGNSNGVTKTIDKNQPQATADIMPLFPGGTEALRKFLQKNLHNPEDLEEGQTISVKIMFIVGYDGVLKGFQTVEDGGAVFNNEVIRVLKKMPAWIPGKTAGENVSVYYTIPVKFVAQE